jgi:hypothetical protein
MATDESTPFDHEKLGSNLGQLAAENGVKPWSVTQSQAKRINDIAIPLLFRDQGVGGSNPLSPTNTGLFAMSELSIQLDSYLSIRLFYLSFEFLMNVATPA